MFNPNKMGKPQEAKNGFEKYASKEARNYNSFIENLLGNGVIDKEDIMRVDAKIESDLMDKLSKLEKEKGNSSDILYYKK